MLYKHKNEAQPERTHLLLILAKNRGNRKLVDYFSVLSNKKMRKCLFACFGSPQQILRVRKNPSLSVFEYNFSAAQEVILSITHRFLSAQHWAQQAGSPTEGRTLSFLLLKAELRVSALLSHWDHSLTSEMFSNTLFFFFF